MKKTKEEAAATRKLLLKKALLVFSQKGYSATTLQDIANEAEVTRGAIYWHFGSKSELYNTLLKEYSTRGDEIVQKAVREGGSLLEILHKVFLRQLELVEFDQEMRALMELHLFKAGQIPELEECRQQQISSGINLVESLKVIMEQGIETGVLRSDIDARDMAKAYLAFQSGLIQQSLSSPDHYSLANNADSFADIFIAGIRSESRN